MTICVLGGQGTGKTTQARLIADLFGLCFVSAGEVVRKIASEDTVEGKSVREKVNKGELAPDDLIWKEISSRLDLCADGFVLDGWPRDREDYFLLKKYLERRNWRIDFIIILELSDETVRNRIKQRTVIERRSDDTPDILERRMEIYKNETKPFLNSLKDKENLVYIDGSGSIGEVTKQILEKMNYK